MGHMGMTTKFNMDRPNAAACLVAFCTGAQERGGRGSNEGNRLQELKFTARAVA